VIRQHKPRIFVKGCDWTGRLPEDVIAACDATGTAIAFVDTEGLHVSDAHAG